MKQQLRKPENWQDFEELCWILWGEIWRCPETKKNGRSGQNQSGVDVYGTPQGEDGYYGIQCKGKDDYTNAKLTKREIEAEIEKAKRFKPKLKKLYFATTANKDVDIEEYVRIKDIQCREIGLFEVHLYCWEDIVSLIDQYQRTHDWYVKKINFKSNFAALVSFSNGSDRLICKPKFFRNYIAFKPQGKFEHMGQIGDMFVLDMPTNYEKIYEDYKKRALSPQPCHFEYNKIYKNNSSILFNFQLENIGDKVLEEFKLEFSIKGDVIVEIVDKKNNFLDLEAYSYNIQLHDSKSGVFKYKNSVLIQKDRIKSDAICIRPTIEDTQEIIIHWKLLCRDFSDSGQMFIDVIPEIKYQETSFYVYEYIIDDDSTVYDDRLRRYFRLDNEIV
ncbi:hypothetical protein GCM10028819_39110 [Spirosoma humi]